MVESRGVTYAEDSAADTTSVQASAHFILFAGVHFNQDGRRCHALFIICMFLFLTYEVSKLKKILLASGCIPHPSAYRKTFEPTIYPLVRHFDFDYFGFCLQAPCLSQISISRLCSAILFIVALLSEEDDGYPDTSGRSQYCHN